VDWLFGSYPEPWRATLRISFVVFWVVFTLNFWGPFSNTLVTIVLLSLIVFQFLVRGYLRSKQRI
jgi:hypothetical protein